MKLVKEHIEFKRGIEPKEIMGTDSTESLREAIQNIGQLMFDEDKERLIFTIIYDKVWERTVLEVNFSTPRLFKKYEQFKKLKSTNLVAYEEAGKKIKRDSVRYSNKIIKKLGLSSVFSECKVYYPKKEDIFTLGTHYYFKEKYNKLVDFDKVHYYQNPNIKEFEDIK